MKRLIIMITLMGFAMTQAIAQQPERQGRQTTQAGQQRQQLTPEERAKMAADRMKEQLDLTEDQHKKVYDLHLKMATAQTEGTREEQMTQRRKLMEEYNEGIKKVLTPEQLEKWEKQRAEQRNRNGRGNNTGRQGTGRAQNN